MTNTNQPDATTSDAPSQPTAGDDYIERSAAIEVLEQQKTNGSDEDAIMDYATEQAIKALRILPAATPTSSHSELADRQFGASYRRDLDRWIIYEQTNDGSVPFAETYGYDKERVDMVLAALRQRHAPEPSGMREASHFAIVVGKYKRETTVSQSELLRLINGGAVIHHIASTRPTGGIKELKRIASIFRQWRSTLALQIMDGDQWRSINQAFDDLERLSND